MASIEIVPAGDEYHVVVRDAGGSSEHEVTIPEGYLQQLGLGACEPGQVLEESMRFLLEREPKESILARFELPVIARYFPEYPKEIRRRLGRS